MQLTGQPEPHFIASWEQLIPQSRYDAERSCGDFSESKLGLVPEELRCAGACAGAMASASQANLVKVNDLAELKALRTIFYSKSSSYYEKEHGSRFGSPDWPWNESNM